MSLGYLDSQYLTDIADSIRSKNGTQNTYTPSQMPQAILDIPSGGTDYMEQRIRNVLSSYTIPNTCSVISAYSFYGQPITSMTIPSSVTRIDDNAFFCCSLTSVTIPNSVTYIGNSAFDSNKLTSISIPNSVTGLNSSAFANNTTLTSVTFDNNMNISLGIASFDGCTSLTTLNNFDITGITGSKPVIPNYCFRNTALVGDISLGNSVNVQQGAFNNYASTGILYIHLTQNDISALSTKYSFYTNASRVSFNLDHCRLVVPYSADHSILAAYQAQWPLYSSIMIEESV